jgi:septal ring factor EnvC (AmiA/AmiB activator)
MIAALLRFPVFSPVFSGAALLVALAGGPLEAADPKPEQKLKAVESALQRDRARQAEAEREAETLSAEIGKLRVESVATAKALQDEEGRISALEEKLAALAADESAKTVSLQQRQQQHERLLMALQRLARHPPEALALGPAEPVDAARAAMLLGAAMPRIQEEAEALEAALAALASVREETRATKAQLVRHHDTLAGEQRKMAQLLQRKAALQARIAKKVEIGAQRLQQLSSQAADLRELIERLEAERRAREAEEQRRVAELLARALTRPPRPEPETTREPSEDAEDARTEVAAAAPPRLDPPKGKRPIAQAKGRLVMPVAGRIARRWGEADEVGAPARGLSFATRGGATAVAPWEGRVQFAGPFRGYGQILIIEHGDGYHSLLAGLERIDAVVGQALVAGEPVGIVKTDDGRPSLYLELRRNGQPIDPLPWLSPRDEKVTG